MARQSSCSAFSPRCVEAQKLKTRQPRQLHHHIPKCVSSTENIDFVLKINDLLLKINTFLLKITEFLLKIVGWLFKNQ